MAFIQNMALISKNDQQKKTAKNIWSDKNTLSQTYRAKKSSRYRHSTGSTVYYETMIFIKEYDLNIEKRPNKIWSNKL